ncbi:hypothetical protein U9M48_034610 [Paspalum notatum var. saurae]|uniref:Uncharacterized protein n=1 Tax=Paspalum notatum var. saurae TaxID=547442 RepID=A0AAQ3UAT3_PASNO
MLHARSDPRVICMIIAMMGKRGHRLQVEPPTMKPLDVHQLFTHISLRTRDGAVHHGIASFRHRTSPILGPSVRTSILPSCDAGLRADEPMPCSCPALVADEPFPCTCLSGLHAAFLLQGTFSLCCHNMPLAHTPWTYSCSTHTSNLFSYGTHEP